MAVAPWTWPGANEQGGSLTTAEALTQATQTALRAQGFDVVDEPSARYRLGCTIHDLSYTVQPGYPGERAYTARVACQLLQAADSAVLWQRDFDERVDETLYVNTYTKLPVDHAQAFARECVPAVMDRLTESLLYFFQEGLPMHAEETPRNMPAVSGEPASPYQK